MGGQRRDAAIGTRHRLEFCLLITVEIQAQFSFATPIKGSRLAGRRIATVRGKDPNLRFDRTDIRRFHTKKDTLSYPIWPIKRATCSNLAPPCRWHPVAICSHSACARYRPSAAPLPRFLLTATGSANIQNLTPQHQQILGAPMDILITRLYLGGMEVQLSPEQEAQLAALAAEEGRSPDDLAREVFGRALAEEARFVEAVKQGLASLDRGEHVSHQEVGARIERLLQS